MRQLLNLPFTALRRPAFRRSCTYVRPFTSTVQVNEAAQSSKDTGKAKTKAEQIPLSSCPENTVLAGMNYLKGQAPVLAKQDEEYPPWLWTLLKPKVYPDDGPGGKGEKMRLRATNRQRIKEQNFLKTQ